LPADAEGRRIEGHVTANAARFNHNDSGRAWHET
jgi:hypothetical protein